MKAFFYEPRSAGTANLELVQEDHEDENIYVEHKPGEYKYPSECHEKSCQIYVEWSTNSNDQVDFVVIGRNTSSINVVLTKGKNEKDMEDMEDGNDVISGYSNGTVFDAHLKG